MLCSSAAVVDLRSEVSSSTGGLIVMREWFFLSLGQLPFPVGGGKCQICSNHKIGRGQLVLFALTCQQTSGEHLLLK